MQKVQLYVEGTRLDLFRDETIELTSTIQDVRDIGKVFTDFSQTFTVPASKTNNKVFKHYYNYSITGNAYDNRIKKSAEIHINHTPFREGKIHLNSVNMRMNKPYSYEVIFYGNTVSLKDLIGDDELTDLSYFDNFDHDYDEVNVRTGLTAGLDFTIDSVSKPDSIIYPLITTKKRLFFDSSVVSPTVAPGNLYCDESNLPDSLSRDNGLEFTDLKPAIRLIRIIEAIESQYGIEFTRSIRKSDGSDRKTFFDSEAFIGDDTTNYYGLYMWLHRNKGDLFEYDLEGTDFNVNLSNFSALPGNYGNGAFFLERLTVDAITDANVDGYNIRLFVYPDSAYVDKTYTINILDYNTNAVLGSRTGEGNLSVEIDITDGIDSAKFFKFSVQSTEAISFSSSNAPRVELATFDSDRVPLEVDQWESTDTAVDRRVVMSKAIPKIKVMDFLTGLFKMFNLTAYYITDYGDVNYGKIYVDTLDNFYTDAVHNPSTGVINIDNHLDVNQHTVSTILPYTDINFQYSETDVVLMENHLAQFNEVFGNSEYNVRELVRAQEGITIDRAKKYDISLPFSHMKYERLYDLSGSLGPNATSETGVQWGYCATGEINADNNYDPTVIQPLIFYAIAEEGLPEASNANSNRSGKINWISSSPYSTALDSYFRPSNSYDDGTPTYFDSGLNAIQIGTPPKYSLNFDQEYDEWQRENYGSRTNSLFNLYYKSYIESVFNAAKRMFKVTAYLPPKIITTLRLNDQIRIQDKMFRINSISSNLNTGKSELELLNVFALEELEPGDLTADLTTITSDTTAITADATEF